jgi:hypothetical protein
MADDPSNLTGIWLSEYEFESTGRGILTGRHYVTARSDGDRLLLRSVPASRSMLAIDLAVKESALLGTWTEETDPGGYYRGKTFIGTLLVIVDPDARRMSGKWTGGDKDGLEVNAGPWTLTLVDSALTPEAVNLWNRQPE